MASQLLSRTDARIVVIATLAWLLTIGACIGLIVKGSASNLIVTSHQNWAAVGAWIAATIVTLAVATVAVITNMFSQKTPIMRFLSLFLFVGLFSASAFALGSSAAHTLAIRVAFRNSTAPVLLEYHRISDIDRHKRWRYFEVQPRRPGKTVRLRVSKHDYALLERRDPGTRLSDYCYPVSLQQQGSDIRAIEPRQPYRSAVRRCGPDW